jgi:hypothetical protein
MDVLSRDAEAALHRVSATGCFIKSSDLSRAANLYRAALAGPLSDAAKVDVEHGSPVGGSVRRSEFPRREGARTMRRKRARRI